MQKYQKLVSPARTISWVASFKEEWLQQIQEVVREKKKKTSLPTEAKSLSITSQEYISLPKKKKKNHLFSLILAFDRIPNLLMATTSRLNQFSKADCLLIYIKRSNVSITT